MASYITTLKNGDDYLLPRTKVSAVSNADGDGLDKLLANINRVEITQAEYDALTDAEKHNNTAYYISDAENIGTAEDITYDATEAYTDGTIGAELTNLNNNKVNVSDIVNNVTSSDTDKPLSANQGRILQEEVDAKVNTADIVNNVTSTTTDVPLAAAQGKILQDQITSNDTDIASLKSDIVRVDETTSNIFGTSDAYSSSTTYAVGDMCIYNNALWRCITACTAQTPSEGTYWTCVSLNSLSKYKLGATTLSNAAQGDKSIKITLPTGKTTSDIYAIIPIGYTPSATWATTLTFTGTTKETIGCRIQGDTTQSYGINYLIIYK